LMDNLLAELFWETNRTLASPASEKHFEAFRELIGLERIKRVDGSSAPVPETAEAVEFLEEVLDNLLSPEKQTIPSSTVLFPESPVSSEDDAADRRAYLRVPENHFIRYRSRSALASTLALLENLSGGGLFIHTPDLLPPGTSVDVDFNVEHEGRGYVVCCQGKVAWVAQDSMQSPLGPGFGIKFVDPPPEVEALLEKIVSHRINDMS